MYVLALSDKLQSTNTLATNNTVRNITDWKVEE